jgi:uncharacterized membrane protein
MMRPRQDRSGDIVINLIAAAVVFLGIHLFISGTPIRDAIIGAIGERAYMGLFSLASLGVIVWMAMAFNQAGAAPGSAADPILYDLGRGTHDAAIPIVAIAFLLGVPGLLTPNPTSVNSDALAAKIDIVRGVLRITRHPFLWGAALWSADHLSTNGDVAGVVFFGTFFLLSLFGTVSIDAKRRRKLGPAWDGFAAQTSNVPFAAILSGRNTFRAGEYFDWRFAVAALLFVALLFGHVYIFGVSPFA